MHIHDLHAADAVYHVEIRKKERTREKQKTNSVRLLQTSDESAIERTAVTTHQTRSQENLSIILCMTRDGSTTGTRRASVKRSQNHCSKIHLGSNTNQMNKSIRMCTVQIPDFRCASWCQVVLDVLV